MIRSYYATETGTAQDLAESSTEALKKCGLDAEEIDLSDIEPDDLLGTTTALFFVSTWGEGDPPSDCEEFFETLTTRDEPLDLSGMRFAVLGLGDTSYEEFCGFAKKLDAELPRHGATRFHPRADCDIDYEDTYEEWFTSVAGLIREPQPA